METRRKISFQEFFRETKKMPTPVQEVKRRAAEVTGKSPRTVDDWCAGRSKPDKANREALAEEFGLDPDHLF